MQKEHAIVPEYASNRSTCFCICRKVWQLIIGTEPFAVSNRTDTTVQVRAEAAAAMAAAAAAPANGNRVLTNPPACPVCRFAEALVTL